MQILETNRLTLRPWRLDDLDEFFGYAKSSVVGPMAGWEPHADKGVSKKILDKFIEDDDNWAVEIKESGALIGSLGLHLDPSRADTNTRMMGYVLGEDYWGMGFATEAAKKALEYAFNGMGLEMVTIYHYPHNTRSKRVIEKCGFKYEGTIRRAKKIYDGTIYDSVYYSLLREEFANER